MAHESSRRHSDPSCLMDRRRFLTTLCGALALTGAGAVLSACAPGATAGRSVSPTPEQPGKSPSSARGNPGLLDQGAESLPQVGALSYTLPNSDGLWMPRSSRVGRLPSGVASIRILDVGSFEFDTAAVETLRPEIFQPGHFSMFDALAHLHKQGDIKLDYHYDPSMRAHVIDAIDGDRGDSGWWYQTYYSGGWSEHNVFRMDLYPWKDATRLSVYPERRDRIEGMFESFREEVSRLEANGGQLVLSEVSIRSPAQSWQFRDVLVTPHDVRADLYQPGAITALDIILSLGEQGEFRNAVLTWYERIGSADPVDSYWLEGLDEAQAHGSCGFVYEAGPKRYGGFSGAHIHLPMDARIILSPEYALWFWICL